MKMRILGVKHLMAKILVFSSIIYFYVEAENIESVVDDGEDQEEADSYANSLQENYQSGFVKMIQFFDSMREDFSKMRESIINLEKSHEELMREMASGFDALNREIARRDQELREDLASVSDDFIPLIGSRKSFQKSTDCGGILELGRGAPSTISFPNPGNAQSCAWKIVPKENFTSHRIKFQSLGMETRVEDVRINYWDSNAKLQTQNVTVLGSWISIPAPHVVITFCSNPSKVSSGFQASILGFGSSGDAANNFKPSWFENSTATFDFSVSEGFSQCIATQMPLMTSEDCGGILELARGAPSTIRFPNLGNNQSCIWTISPHGNFTSYRLKFQSLRTETRLDGVRINYLDASAKLQSQKVTEVGSWIPILAPFVLVTFCSHPSQVSSGFEASILGFGSSGDAPDNSKPSWFGNSTETFDLLVSQNFAHCIPTHLTTSTDCGGLLGVAPGVPSTIRYPNSGNYRAWECCAWTLVPAEKFASFQMKFQSFGMEARYDGVKIYHWSSTLELQSKKVTEFGSWISIPAPYAVITFCSYDAGNIVGGGFGASILGLGTSTDSAVFKPFWLTNRTETFSYPPGNYSTGSSNEIVSVVVQQPNQQDNPVSLSVYQIGNDNIKPYNLQCRHDWSTNYVVIGRSGGGNSSWTTYKSSGSLHPKLVIFKSNSRKSGERFTISY